MPISHAFVSAKSDGSDPTELQPSDWNDDHVVTGLLTSNAGGGDDLSTIAASGTTETIDLANGNVHDITLTDDCTFTFTSPAAGKARSFTLFLRQGASPPHLATWPGSVAWVSGSAPTLATGLAGVDVLTFVTLDGGTVWYGFADSAAGGGDVATDTIWDAAGDLAVGTGANTAARVAIGASGLLLKSNGTTAAWARQTFIGASAYKNASQNINDSTEVALLLDTEDYDTSAFHDTGSNTSRMTIPSGLDGKYMVTGHAYYDNNTSGHRQIYLYKNGAPVGATHKITPISGDNFLFLTHVLAMAATDYIELYTYQSSGGSRVIGDPSSYGDRYKVRFTITFLGV